MLAVIAKIINNLANDGTEQRLQTEKTGYRNIPNIPLGRFREELSPKYSPTIPNPFPYFEVKTLEQLIVSDMSHKAL
jgi:hypothetical protein